MKQCFICQEWLPISEFYRHKEMADGHLNKCKECTKLGVRNNRQENIDYYREYDRTRSREGGDRRITPLTSDQQKQHTAAYRAKYPEKYMAHTAVNNAVRDGRLYKPDYCEECGNYCNPEAHHEDYAYPLEVIWLCKSCHGLLSRLY